jgi:ribosomal protein S18 acetylase RimI-like enzyme
MNIIEFRKAVIEDLVTLYEFEQGIIAAERPFDQTLKVGHINYYDLEEFIMNEKSEVFVATFNQTIVGSASVIIKESEPFLKHDSFAYLGFMFVEPMFRGKGVNLRLIQELKKWSKEKNLTEIRLKVYHDNLPALKAYSKAGFKEHLVEMRLDLNQEEK